MTLTQRVILILVVVFAVAGAVSFASYRWLVASEFTALEQTQDEARVALTRSVIELYRENVEYLTEDFGYWDVTHDFVQGRAPKFEQENFAPGELAFLGADIVLIIDRQGRTLLRRATDRYRELVAADGADDWSRLLLVGNGLSGFVASTPEPLMVSSSPIVGTNESRPGLGYVVAARIVDKALLEEISSFAQVDLSLDTRISDTTEISRDTVRTRVFMPIPTIDGQGQLGVTYSVTRSMYEQSTLNLYWFGLAMLFVFVASVVAVYFSLSRWVLKDVDRLSRSMQQVGSALSPPDLQATRRSDELGHLARNFSDMLARLDQQRSVQQQKDGVLSEEKGVREKSAALGRLSAGMAHDFNNLLTVIMGSLELTRHSRNNPESIDQLAGEALAASRRASERIEQILSYAGIQRLEPESVNLREALDEMLPQIQQVVGPDVELELPSDGGGEHVWLDRKRLSQAVLKVIANAKDAMPTGGRLSILVEAIASKEEPSVSLTIRDTGFGMSRETEARAFDPYFTTKPFGDGSGLGLSMVHGFVEQSGGKVRIESSPGVGTSVVILLPSQPTG